MQHDVYWYVQANDGDDSAHLSGGFGAGSGRRQQRRTDERRKQDFTAVCELLQMKGLTAPAAIEMKPGQAEMLVRSLPS